MITFTLQVVFVPRVGYVASAFSSTVCYFVIMLLSYFIGRNKLRIPYDFRTIGGYTSLTLGLLACYYGFRMLGLSSWLLMLFGTALLIVYLVILVKRDFPLSGLPVIGKYFKPHG